MRDELYHILDQEDGEFLAEANVFGDSLEVYNTLDSFGTQTMPDYASDVDTYKEIIDFAAFAMGVDKSSIYLTDEGETQILWAE